MLVAEMWVILIMLGFIFTLLIKQNLEVGSLSLERQLLLTFCSAGFSVTSTWVCYPCSCSEGPYAWFNALLLPFWNSYFLTNPENDIASLNVISILKVASGSQNRCWSSYHHITFAIGRRRKGRKSNRVPASWLNPFHRAFQWLPSARHWPSLSAKEAEICSF